MYKTDVFISAEEIKEIVGISKSNQRPTVLFRN